MDSASRPVTVYRGRPGSKRLKGAQKYAQHPTGFTELRVAFIPSPSGERLHLKFNKAGAVTDVSSDNGIHRRVYLFADYEDEDKPGQVINDPETVLARIFKADKGRSDFWHILNGEWEIKSGEFAAKFVADEMHTLIGKYGRDYAEPMVSTKKGMESAKNHYAENWLNGLAGYSFFNQGDFNEYKKARGFTLGKKRKKFKSKEDV